MTVPAERGAGATEVVACTCPYGWVVANFGWHRGPGQCPIYEQDLARREARNLEPAGLTPPGDEAG